jgi:hypothetical protein
MSYKLRLAPIVRLAPIAMTLAVIVAGCGSSTGSSTSAGSRAELVAQADPICEQVAAERTAANKALEKVAHSTTKELQVLARLAPPIGVREQQAVARLRTLSAPSSLSADWQQVLTGMQQLAEDTTKIAADAKVGNLKHVEAVTASGRKLRQKLTTLAAHFGFVYCGRTS